MTMSIDDSDTQPHEIYRLDRGLWDARDVASYLKASRSWVYHQAEAGQLPCLKIGGLLRFDPEVIKRLVRSRSAS
jgi:excisionase family DNA binding protein